MNTRADHWYRELTAALFGVKTGLSLSPTLGTFRKGQSHPWGGNSGARGKLQRFVLEGTVKHGTFTAVAYPGGGTMGIHDQQWPWFAVMVRAKREKCANAILENAGYQCFLPLNKSIRRWSDRTKSSEVPLFPGYLFCRMDPQNRMTVLMTPGVIQILGIGKTPTPVKDGEIAAIQRIAESGLSAMPWPYVQVGNVVRIENGPLRGLTGNVFKIKTGLKLVVSVELLQRSVAVEIDRGWISVPLVVGPDPIQRPPIPFGSQSFVPVKQENRAGYYGRAS